MPNAGYGSGTTEGMSPADEAAYLSSTNAPSLAPIIDHSWWAKVSNAMPYVVGGIFAAGALPGVGAPGAAAAPGAGTAAAAGTTAAATGTVAAEVAGVESAVYAGAATTATAWTTANIVTAGITAAGIVANVIGQVKAGNAAKAAGEATAQLNEYNARQAELQADDALRQGGQQASRFSMQVHALIGQQRAGFAGQNVDVTTGSAADVQADAQRLGGLDIRQIRQNAEREAWGHKVEAQDYRMGADIARKGGQAAATAAKWGAATSVLGAGSSLLLAKYGWQDTRVPTSSLG